MCIGVPSVVGKVGSLPVPKGNIKTIMDKFIGPLFKMAAGANLCFGDYPGEELKGSKLSELTCNTFPLDISYTYGVLAGVVNNVPCGSPQTVSLCLAFDRCGTVAISINGGVAVCLATLSTGIAAIIGPLGPALKFAAIGFSLERRFVRTFETTWARGNDIGTSNVTTRGHFYFGLGVQLPLDQFKIGSKKISDYINLEVEASIMIDFGHVIETAKRFIDNILHADKNTGKKLIQTIMSAGAELTVLLSGVLYVKLGSLTKGFLNDFSFDIGKASLLITTGNGSSGLETGLYIHLTTNLAAGFSAFITGLFDQFASILKYLGFKKPSIPKLNVQLSLFIQASGIGFKIKFPGLDAACVYHFHSNNGSCKFNSAIFTAIAEGVKWLIKSAKALFDKGGKIIASVAQGVGKFAKNAAHAIGDLAKDAGKAIGNELKKGVNTLKTAGKVVGKAVGNEVKKGVNTLKNTGKKVGNFLKKLF